MQKETQIQNAIAIVEGVKAIIKKFGTPEEETLKVFSKAYERSMKLAAKKIK